MGGLARSPQLLVRPHSHNSTTSTCVSDSSVNMSPPPSRSETSIPNAPVAPAACNVAAGGSTGFTPLSRGSGSRLKRLKLSDDLSDDSVILTDNSAFKEFVDNCNSNIELLLKENQLLRSELSDVKSILMNLVKNQLPAQSYPNVPSYASVVKPKIVQKPLLINPKTPQKSDITRKQLVENLNPVNYVVNSTINTKSGGVIINCASSEERNKLKINATAVLGDNYDVSVPTKCLPRVRVFGYSQNYNESEFINAFKSQNSHLLSDICYVKVIAMFTSQSRFGAKIEVDSISLSKLIEAGKVSIGFEYAWVREDLNVRRCYKCFGFNHNARKCTSDIFRCPLCAGEHQRNECSSKTERCITCLNAINLFHLKIDPNHSALSSSCPSYLHRIDLARRSIDYDS